MDPWNRYRLMQTRRHFFGATAAGIGTAALGSLLQDDLQAAKTAVDGTRTAALPGVPPLPHFAPTAKRVIWLFQSGGPSQMDLFDYKPALAPRRGEELPESIRQGQRLTSMTSEQGSFPVAPSIYEFAPNTASREPGSASSCPGPPRSPTTSASSGPCIPRPSITIRPSPFS